MSEYIRREDALDAFGEEYVPRTDFERGMVSQMSCDKEKIKALPSADVVQVIHGKWMKEDRGHVEYCAVCDQCGFDWMWSDRGYFKFCPNCGAKMDAQREE